MNRYFIRISYRGTNYHGWQIQPNAITVQAIVGEALTRILRQSISTTGCGRTDTGVHASMFYFHFDLEEKLAENEANKLCHRLNAYLPTDISVYSIRIVTPEAHARFSALARTYQYMITTRKDPFLEGYAWHYHFAPLDIVKLNQGASIILEYNDFACFSKKDTDIVGTQCVLMQSFWLEKNDLLIYTVKANRFLRNMVRAIVGTLVEIGRSKWDKEKLRHILESRDRCQAGESVPACGLYLTEVTYPSEIFQDF
ncbi:MAG: tRNA pseudouridine(38-40) synthase TruA [Bacteroidetes bacterium]|nr:tRNA pseudouridine(38-40) synthase TruA [Bacteroidota bacterium]